MPSPRLPLPCASASVAFVLLAGCAAGPGAQPERGPNGTVAYQIRIESSEPGARVEVDDDIVMRRTTGR